MPRQIGRKSVFAFIHADVAPAALALSRVAGLQFNLGVVLQVMSAAKKESKRPMWFIEDDVAPVVTALSTVPGLQFNLGDVLQVMSAAEGIEV